MSKGSKSNFALKLLPVIHSSKNNQKIFSQNFPNQKLADLHLVSPNNNKDEFRDIMKGFKNGELQYGNNIENILK